MISKLKTASGRNEMIKKIHVARRKLALEEESYRAILMRVTGKSSCSDMSIGQLDDVIKEFKRLGFKSNKARAGTRKMATSVQASKIRAFWLDLYHLGQIDDPSEQALAGFVKRSCGIDDLNWINASHADQVIRALRGWLTRIGYVHPDVLQMKHIATLRRSQDLVSDFDMMSFCAKLNVIQLQHKKLAIQPPVNLWAFDYDCLDRMIEQMGVDVRHAV